MMRACGSRCGTNASGGSTRIARSKLSAHELEEEEERIFHFVGMFSAPLFQLVRIKLIFSCRCSLRIFQCSAPVFQFLCFSMPVFHFAGTSPCSVTPHAPLAMHMLCSSSRSVTPPRPPSLSRSIISSPNIIQIYRIMINQDLYFSCIKINAEYQNLPCAKLLRLYPHGPQTPCHRPRGPLHL